TAEPCHFTSTMVTSPSIRIPFTDAPRVNSSRRAMLPSHLPLPGCPNAQTQDGYSIISNGSHVRCKENSTLEIQLQGLISPICQPMMAKPIAIAAAMNHSCNVHLSKAPCSVLWRSEAFCLSGEA